LLGESQGDGQQHKRHEQKDAHTRFADDHFDVPLEKICCG